MKERKGCLFIDTPCIAYNIQVVSFAELYRTGTIFSLTTKTLCLTKLLKT